MKKNQTRFQGGPIPIRLEEKQNTKIREFQEMSGLSKSFIIRRCIHFAMEKFSNGEVDIVTLQEHGKK